MVNRNNLIKKKNKNKNTRKTRNNNDKNFDNKIKNILKNLSLSKKEKIKKIISIPYYQNGKCLSVKQASALCDKAMKIILKKYNMNYKFSDNKFAVK
jgi:hypothetical protein